MYRFFVKHEYSFITTLEIRLLNDIYKRLITHMQITDSIPQKDDKKHKEKTPINRYPLIVPHFDVIFCTDMIIFFNIRINEF